MRTWFRARFQACAEARAKAHAEARAKTEARVKARAEAEAQAHAEAEAEARAKTEARIKARIKARAEARAEAQARAKARMDPIFWETSYYRQGVSELDGKLLQVVTPITVTHYAEPWYCPHVEKAWVDRIEHADHIPNEDWYAAYCPCDTRIAEMIITGINEYHVFRIAEIKRVIKKVRAEQAEQPSSSAP